MLSIYQLELHNTFRLSLCLCLCNICVYIYIYIHIYIYIYIYLCVCLTFNIICYLVFQNIRHFLQELHILLTPDQKHQIVFQDIPVTRLHSSKSLKDHLVTAKLPNVEITLRSKSCRTRNCQVFDFICNTDTFSPWACGKTLNIQINAPNSNFQKVT